MKALQFYIVLFLMLLPAFLFGQNVSIGDILCTDGSTVRPEQFASSGKTAEGVVFFVDSDSRQGWAVSLECQAANTHWVTQAHYEEWYDIPMLENYEYSREALYDLDGYNNTDIIRSTHGADWYPAAWSVDFGHGWYLPAAGQLRWLIAYINEINASLAAVNGEMFVYDHPRWYWSSTERTGAHAVVISQTGSVGNYPKWNYIGEYEIGVRAVKNFTIEDTSYHIGDVVTTPNGQRGVVFYTSPEDGSYWLVALNDLPRTYNWGPETDIPRLNNYNAFNQFVTLHGVFCGYNATLYMKEAMGASSQYASSNVDLDNGWHIPSAGQLSKLYAALPFIETLLIRNGGSTLSGDYYWASTECSGENAWAINFGDNPYTEGILKDFTKMSSFHIRPVWSEPCSAAPPLPNPTLPDNIIDSDCNQTLEGSPWNIQLLYSNNDNNVASYAPIIAGDIDDDGIVDIVTARYSNSNYYSFRVDIHRGDNLDLQYSFPIPDTLFNSNGPYAIGRYPLENGAKQGAIFIHCNDKFIRSFAIDGTLLNVSDRPLSCDGMVSLADFNGDGYPEVYAGSDIFDAATLKWLCSGPADGNKGLGHRGAPLHTSYATHHTYYAMSLAYNILGDEKQELICGNTIYNVNITSRTNPALNSVTVNKTITPPSGFSQDGHVTLADFDLDGESEVLVIRDNTNDQTIDDTYFYAYKPSNGHILFQKAHYCRCTGFVTVGNIDNDPHPEMVFLEDQPNGSTEKIFCWRYTTQNGFETVWSQAHDDRSGQTGLTLFDFNQDGIMEIVYRDNRNLRILNASGKSHVTGNDTIRPYNVYARMMAAGTGVEYPIVVDVNGDGYAEIVATGMLDTSYTGQDIGYGGLHVFGSPGNWSPARPVWNQYMYHVTNVNEDLTIPTSCFDKATIFTGTDGILRRPYNNFLQQACYITPNGEPYNPSGYVKAEHYGEGCESYTFHGITYTESGDYEYLIENPLGCDTLLTMHVQIGDTIHTALYKSECTPYVWNGTTYDETGIYEQAFTSEQGCDSIVTLYLTIGNQIFTNFAVSTCDSYTWNGTTYNQTGVYSQTFPSSQGCDSIVILDLTIKNSAHVSSIHGESLIYYQTNGIYSYSIDPVPGCFGYEWSIDGPWRIDTSPDSPECSVNINAPGTATLKVRVYTECGYIERTLFINHDARPDIVIYPNPTKGEFNIVLHGMQGEAVIVVYDYLGQFIDRFSVDTDVEGTIVPYSLAGKAAGVYLINVINHYEKVTKKAIKETASSHGTFLWGW